jgi:mono/diheme cytochrome c family protein
VHSTELMRLDETGLEHHEGLDVMRLDLGVTALLPAVLAASLTCAVPVLAQQPAPPAPDNATFNVEQLIASTCGFCHSDGGRAAGKGPQLMGTTKSDDFIRERIKDGKQGAMPAFGGALSDAQIDDIIKYIRSLKPQEG